MFSLTNEDLNLTAGEYVIMIDPIWNASAKTDLEYKKIYIDIYAPLQVELKPIDDRAGF